VLVAKNVITDFPPSPPSVGASEPESGAPLDPDEPLEPLDPLDPDEPELPLDPVATGPPDEPGVGLGSPASASSRVACPAPEQAWTRQRAAAKAAVPRETSRRIGTFFRRRTFTELSCNGRA
jgi:hypothetical protein